MNNPQVLFLWLQSTVALDLNFVLHQKSLGLLLVQKVARTSPSMAWQRQFSFGPTCLAMPWRSWWFFSDFDSISILIDAYLDAKLCSIHLAVSTLEAFGICYTAHIVGILCIGFIGDVIARCGGSVHSWQPLQAFERQVAKHCYVYSFLPHCCIDFTLLVQKVQWVNKRRKHSFARAWQERTLTRWTTSFEQWERNELTAFKPKLCAKHFQSPWTQAFGICSKRAEKVVLQVLRCLYIEASPERNHLWNSNSWCWFLFDSMSLPGSCATKCLKPPTSFAE